MAKVTFNEDKCKGCGMCAAVCPKGVLALSRVRLNKKGHSPMEQVNPEGCIGCACCGIMCPDCIITVER